MSLLNAFSIPLLNCLKLITDGKLKKYKKYSKSLGLILYDDLEINCYFVIFISYRKIFGAVESFLKCS